MTTHQSVTVEDLRAAYECSAWRGAVSFGHALEHPVISRTLVLGAHMLNQPPPRLDHKRRAAGETEKDFA